MLSPLRPPTIDFRRDRDAGGVLNAAFGFLRENWRGLLRALAVLVGPVVLVLLVAQTLLAGGDAITLGVLVELLRGFVITAVANTVIVGYMLLYMERGPEGVELADLRALLRSDAAAVFGVTVLSLLASAMAGVLLLLPGVYLVVATSLAATVRMAEESTVASAISRSIDLVRGHWWQTAGIVAISLIVSFLISAIVELPAYLGALFATETLADQLESPSLAVVLLTLLEDCGTVLVALIFDTTMAVHYFSLVERKEGPGMLARIDEIGADDATASFDRHQYQPSGSSPTP